MICPCGSNSTYETCCGIFHSGKQTAPTAEALMRSRYSAFAKLQITYLKETTWPPYQKHFDEAGYLARAKDSIWLELEIEDKEAGGESDTKGTVTFIAKSMVNGELNEQTEKSLFRKKNGVWFYVKPTH
jgi:SEC-C motif-containing protein